MASATGAMLAPVQTLAPVSLQERRFPPSEWVWAMQRGHPRPSGLQPVWTQGTRLRALELVTPPAEGPVSDMAWP